jgi:hypothetical protein
VPLRSEPMAPEPLPKPKPLSRLHGLATGGMALCAFVGILSLVALITVRWPGTSSRYVKGVFIAAGFGLLLCCCIAVFSAARDTYARNGVSAADKEGE